jgi:hypothetical protein
MFGLTTEEISTPMKGQKREVEGLRNIVESDRANPENLRLAIAGALLEDEPEAALEAIFLAWGKIATA